MYFNTIIRFVKLWGDDLTLMSACAGGVRRLDAALSKDPLKITVHPGSLQSLPPKKFLNTKNTKRTKETKSRFKILSSFSLISCISCISC